MGKDSTILEKEWGWKIRKAHISQEELSFRCGLSKNYISDVERGTRNISLKAISKLAYGLHVEIKDLFTFPK